MLRAETAEVTQRIADTEESVAETLARLALQHPGLGSQLWARAKLSPARPPESGSGPAGTPSRPGRYQAYSVMTEWRFMTRTWLPQAAIAPESQVHPVGEGAAGLRALAGMSTCCAATASYN
jgi:hypothetical protein